MLFSKSSTALFTLSLTALITGCSTAQSEKDMLAEAQFCLDKATNASLADACIAKIQGLTSEKSYALRCAAGFISSGITQPENLSTALNSMKESGGSTAGVLGVLAFDSQELANVTFNNCTQSGSSGLQLVAAMAKTATVISNLTSGSGSLESQFQTAITNIVADLSSGDPADKAAAAEKAGEIGGAIQSVYQTSCTGTDIGNAEMCASIEGALAVAPPGVDMNSSPDAIGAALLEYWKTN